MNSYGKAAVSSILSISNVKFDLIFHLQFLNSNWKIFFSQIERDEKIMSLIECMSDAYLIIPSEETMREVKDENIKRCVDLMMKQTIECGNYIKKYVSSHFGMSLYMHSPKFHLPQTWVYR